MTNKNIKEALKKMSLTELLKLNESVIAEIKLKRSQEDLATKQSLEIGDFVQFIDNDGTILKGKIVKKNRTRAVIQFDKDSRNWTVPFSCLTKTQQGA
tara:strand:- start:704 stop:997 length:294 start_codon:yes stop_codon:yes gene_type:complete